MARKKSRKARASRRKSSGRRRRAKKGVIATLFGGKPKRRRRRSYRFTMVGPKRRRSRRRSRLTLTFRPNRGRRRGRRSYRRNPVVPVSWNPSRRRRRSRRSYRRNGVLPVQWNGRRRRYRRNGVLPIRWNPAGSLAAAPREILGKLKTFVDVSFWLNTGVPSVLGFVGSRTLGNRVYEQISSRVNVPTVIAPVAKIASHAAAGATLAYVAGRFLPLASRAKIAQSLWLGTVISVAHSVLLEFLPSNVKSAIGLSGMGENLSVRMREAVQRRVRNNMHGLNAYMTRREVSGLPVGSFVTEREMRSQSGYSALPTGALNDYDVANPASAF